MAGSLALALARWLVVALPAELGSGWRKLLAAALPSRAWREQHEPEAI